MPSTISAGTTAGTAVAIAGDTSGELQLRTNGTTPAVTISTAQNTTFAQTINAPNTFGFKNRVINGNMTISQRIVANSTTPTVNGTYTLDRWISYISQASKFSVQQDAGGVTPPPGFTDYLGVTSLAATSLGAGDFFTVGQNIEGYNMADLDWGTANAKTATLSFWVRSSLTGTFGGAFRNQAASRSYPFSYTISAANTWEYKTIVVPGDTTGTWEKTTGNGCHIFFSLGMGSSGSGTAGAWAASSFASATGATSVVGTNGATFYLTGVQFEIGSTATSFDYRDFATELTRCQRYYEKSFDLLTAPNHGTGGLPVIPIGSSLGCGGNAYFVVLFKTHKRISSFTLRWFDPLGSQPQSENWIRVITACDSGTTFGPNSNLQVNSNTTAQWGGYSQVGTATPPIIYWTADAEIG